MIMHRLTNLPMLRPLLTLRSNSRALGRIVLERPEERSPPLQRLSSVT